MAQLEINGIQRLTGSRLDFELQYGVATKNSGGGLPPTGHESDVCL